MWMARLATMERRRIGNLGRTEQPEKGIGRLRRRRVLASGFILGLTLAGAGAGFFIQKSPANLVCDGSSSRGLSPRLQHEVQIVPTCCFDVAGEPAVNGWAAQPFGRVGGMREHGDGTVTRSPPEIFKIADDVIR